MSKILLASSTVLLINYKSFSEYLVIENIAKNITRGFKMGLEAGFIIEDDLTSSSILLSIGKIAWKLDFNKIKEWQKLSPCKNSYELELKL